MNDEGQESIQSGYASLRMIILGIAFAALFIAQACPARLGRLGTDALLFVSGCLVALATRMDIRSGTSNLGLATFKRSADSTGFWTAVVVGFAASALLALAALGDAAGLWQI